jgi:hypothetical protein
MYQRFNKLFPQTTLQRNMPLYKEETRRYYTEAQIQFDVCALDILNTM